MSTREGFAIAGGRILRDGRALLADLSLRLPDYAVTAIMGPAGVGKSSLLAVLAGRQAERGVRSDGRFSLRGLPLAAATAHELAYLPQRRGPTTLAALHALIASAPSVLLLDEPRLAPPERATLLALLGAQRARGLALLVTHDLTLARAAADYVCLLCAGKLEALAPTEAFFSAPPTPLAAQLVRLGSCWPRGDAAGGLS